MFKFIEMFFFELVYGFLLYKFNIFVKFIICVCVRLIEYIVLFVFCKFIVLNLLEGRFNCSLWVGKNLFMSWVFKLFFIIVLVVSGLFYYDWCCCNFIFVFINFLFWIIFFIWVDILVFVKEEICMVEFLIVVLIFLDCFRNGIELNFLIFVFCLVLFLI